MKINKHIGISIILCLCVSYGFAQSQKSFDSLVLETNEYLKKYAELSPFGAYRFVSLEKSGLPKKEIKFIKEHFEEYDGYTKDSISGFSLLLEFQGLIIDNITSIISHQKFKDNKIEEVIHQNLDLSIVVSDDRKLFNFSLDEKTGGTYRSRISITHYTEDDIIPSLKNKRDIPEIVNQHKVFKGDGFNNIYSLETEEGTKYVLTGYVRGCSLCFETKTMLISYRNGTFEQDFSYAVNSRSWEGGVNYDPVTKTITVDYTTDDLTTQCNCLNHAVLKEDDVYTDDEQESTTTKCHCTFKFNGSNFDLVKELQEIIKE